MEGTTRVGVTWPGGDAVWDNTWAENTGALLSRTPELGYKLNFLIDDNIMPLFSENTITIFDH